MPYLYSHIVVHLILRDRDRFGFLMVKSNGLVKLWSFIMFQIWSSLFQFQTLRGVNHKSPSFF